MGQAKRSLGWHLTSGFWHKLDTGWQGRLNMQCVYYKNTYITSPLILKYKLFKSSHSRWRKSVWLTEGNQTWNHGSASSWSCACTCCMRYLESYKCCQSWIIIRYVLYSCFIDLTYWLYHKEKFEIRKKVTLRFRNKCEGISTVLHVVVNV